jgi:hypothetical protein
MPERIQFTFEIYDGKQYVIETLDPHGSRVTTNYGPFESYGAARRFVVARKRKVKTPT